MTRPYQQSTSSPCTARQGLWAGESSHDCSGAAADAKCQCQSASLWPASGMDTEVVCGMYSPGQMNAHLSLMMHRILPMEGLIQNARLRSIHWIWGESKSVIALEQQQNMGCSLMSHQGRTSQTLALQVDGDGNIRYDAIARQGQRDGKYIQSSAKDLVPLLQRSDAKNIVCPRSLNSIPPC